MRFRFIDINSGFQPGLANKLLVKPSTAQVVQITGVLVDFEQIYGTPVCRIGAGSADHNSVNSYYTARKCGTIVVADTDVDGTTDQNSQSCVTISGQTTCKWIHHMKVVSFDSWGGDSGGPVFEPTVDADTTATLFGTHVHSEDGEWPTATKGWYTTQYQGYIELHAQGIELDVCVTATC